jgi:hypothetical protein
MHSVIHSICLGCTSPSHVRSLIDQGILQYWERIIASKDEENGDVAVSLFLDSLSHLISFDISLTEAQLLFGSLQGHLLMRL